MALGMNMALFLATWPLPFSGTKKLWPEGSGTQSVAKFGCGSCIGMSVIMVIVTVFKRVVQMCALLLPTHPKLWVCILAVLLLLLGRCLSWTPHLVAWVRRHRGKLQRGLRWCWARLKHWCRCIKADVKWGVYLVRHHMRSSWLTFRLWYFWHVKLPLKGWQKGCRYEVIDGCLYEVYDPK